MGIPETFAWGFFGGIGAELAVLFAVRQQNPADFPHWVRSWVYYIAAFLMAVAGGFVATAYARSGTALTAILAIQVGASAPLFFRKARDVVAKPPSPPEPGQVD